MMANINRQEIARLPVKQESNFVFKFSEDGWYIPTKKIWGKKEIDRICFKIVDGEKENWFECGINLAEKIQEVVDEVLKEGDIDVPNVELLDVSIVRKGVNEPKIFINVEKLPKVGPSKWSRVWMSVKNTFKKKDMCI